MEKEEAERNCGEKGGSRPVYDGRGAGEREGRATWRPRERWQLCRRK